MLILIFWPFLNYFTLIILFTSIFFMFSSSLFIRIGGYFRFVTCFTSTHVNRLSYLYFYSRTRFIKVTDKRIKIMQQMIQAMQIVKMYCWQESFERQILLLRKFERFTKKHKNDCDSSIFSTGRKFTT